MQRVLLSAIIALAVAGTALAAPAPKPAASAPATEAALESFVDGVVLDAMGAEHIAGVAVTVVQGDRTILAKGYGLADVKTGRAVDPAQTLFRIGSLSKTFTWIALLNEVERGQVRLDAPVNDYLPDALKIPDQGFKTPIRVIDLMSHSAGFEDTGIGHMFVDTGAKVTALETYLATHRPRRVREPGKVSTYSNYGAALAGYIAARSRGLDFPTLIDQEITGPLGMAGTTFREPYPARRDLAAPMSAALAARVATGYSWTGGAYRPRRFEYIGQIQPAGSASATAADMATYMRMQLAGGVDGGKVIYGPSTAAALRSPIFERPGGNGWAHGYIVSTLPGGQKAYGHAGATGFFLSNMVLVPELDLGIFVTTNTDTGRPLTARLPELVAGRVAGKAPVFKPGDPALIKQARLYSGAYVSTRRAYAGLEKFVSMLAAAGGSVSVTPGGYLITRAGPASQAWIPDGAPGRFVSATGEQRIRFDIEGGRAVGFTPSNGMSYMERAGLFQSAQLFQLLGGLTLIAALASIFGAFTRRGRDIRPTQAQSVSSLVGIVVSVLWLVAVIGFALWGASAGDRERLVYNFPGLPLTVASSAALIATVLSAALLIALPLTWKRAPTGQGGWSLGRKIRHAMAVVLFLGFGALVGVWGGLIPWQ